MSCLNSKHQYLSLLESKECMHNARMFQFYSSFKYHKGSKRSIAFATKNALNASPKIPFLVPWFEILGMVAIEFDIFVRKI